MTRRAHGTGSGPFRLLGAQFVATLFACGLAGCAASHVSAAKHSPTPETASVKHEAELDLPVSELGRAGPPEGDCNENEIPDSVDIANQYEDDNNHNGEIDPCEIDAVPGSYDPRTKAWESTAARADTLAMFRTFAKRVGIVMECYVPARSGTARLVVRDTAGIQVSTISECLSPGAHRAFWPLRDGNGLIISKDVVYVISLEQGSHSTRRAVRWNREYRF